MANSVDPDQMQHSVASHLGLYCLQRPISPNTHGYYGTQQMTENISLGPVVQSLVSLMSSLRVILLTVLADSIYNNLIFFAEKM